MLQCDDLQAAPGLQRSRSCSTSDTSWWSSRWLPRTPAGGRGPCPYTERPSTTAAEHTHRRLIMAPWGYWGWGILAAVVGGGGRTRQS